MINCLAGNRRVLDSIDNLLKSNALPHAVIIEGDEGTGKHTLSLLLAKASLCKGVNKPCEECTDCRLSNGSNHPDIEFFKPEDKKKSLSVEQIRKIRANAFVKSHRGGKKVFIIDKADFLSENSQNALLKVIEEPPQDILFILICLSTTRLLETIISRCVTFSLFPPEEAEALEYLKTVSKKSEEEIKNALHNTHNNIGKAKALLNKRKSDKALLAEKFLDAVLESEQEIDLLLLLKPLEKDRVKTAEFISELKILTAEMVRKNLRFPTLSGKLLEMYETLSEMEELLPLNVNLPLFFTLLVSKLNFQ